MQPPQQVFERVGHVEERGRAHRANIRRKAVQHDGYLAIGGRRPPQRYPAVEPITQLSYAFGHERNLVSHKSAQDDRVDGAVELGQRVQDHGLQSQDAVGFPHGYGLKQEGACYDVRDIEVGEQCGCDVDISAGLHRSCGSAYERKADGGDNGVYGRGLVGFIGRISRDRAACHAVDFVLGGEPISNDGVRLNTVDEHRHGY
mmetsp:Transcript_25381/g.54829  ORF Transcript_25381/g.54829 Transcript_25381/m.54829 type:complete len:202 (-) Transcript_25381:1284-1889(-)